MGVGDCEGLWVEYFLQVVEGTEEIVFFFGI